ncbi:hypothetical protein WOC76_20105 [Methylocystis sp. IM3]|uniref:hypothetical protein n=1 Tax=unclassified Methylocystis TaxID=2625913 RepID=UPI0030F6ABEE
MSVTFRETRTYGGMVGAGLLDAAGGVATIVLAICGLTGIHPPILASVAVIVLGAELIARGAMIASVLSTAATESAADLALMGESGGGLAALFLAGLGGVTLGVLALLGVAELVLTAVATIAFGVALVLSNGSGAIMLSADSTAMGEGSLVAESVPAVAGLVAIVLGILALVLMGKAASGLSLILAALLILGAAVVVSGSGMGLMMQSLARRGE